MLAKENCRPHDNIIYHFGHSLCHAQKFDVRYGVKPLIFHCTIKKLQHLIPAKEEIIATPSKKKELPQ